MRTLQRIQCFSCMYYLKLLRQSCQHYYFIQIFQRVFFFFNWSSKTRASVRVVARNELKEATLNLILLARGTARPSIPHRPARGNQCIKLSVNNCFQKHEFTKAQPVIPRKPCQNLRTHPLFIFQLILQQCITCSLINPVLRVVVLNAKDTLRHAVFGAHCVQERFD